MSSAILSGSARRYAAAAFGVARDAGDLDTWLRAIDEVALLFHDARASAILTSPAVDAGDKRAVLDRLVPNLPSLVRNFLNILIERDRLSEAAGIADAFRELVNRERGILTADVTTAIPLEPDMERTIAQRLGTHLGHDSSRLVIRSRVDPKIIGGVVARVGDTLIDDSVQGRLERLRRVLTPSGR